MEEWQKILKRVQAGLTKRQETFSTRSITKVPSECRDFARFVALKPGEDPEGVAKLRKAGEAFWRSMLSGKPPFWLTLSGSTGVGKTHLAKRLQRAFYLMTRLQAQGDIYLGPGRAFYSAGFYHWPSIADGFNRGRYEILDDMATDWFAVIDDIGATRQGSERIEQLILDKLFQVLNRRQNQWTIITTNMKLKALHQQEPRLADRLIREPNQVLACAMPSYASKSAPDRFRTFLNLSAPDA